MNTFEWKQFHIKCIQPEDYPLVLEHLRENFYLEEPVNKWFGVDKERISDYDRRMVDMMSRYAGCLMAVPKNDPTKVAGVLIVHFHDLDNPLPDFTPSSSITTKFLEFLHQLEKSFNVHEGFGISCFPELAILSIDKDFRGLGLATELYRRAISQLFSEGEDRVPLIYSEFSNPISRKVGERLGFEEMGRFYFKQFQSPGAMKGNEIENLSKNSEDEEPFVSLTVLHRKELK